MKSLETKLQILTRGCVDIVTIEELQERLKQSLTTQKPLKVKAGFDPTAPDLHLGHTVLLRKMRQFQSLGHTVIFLIGDFTGLIGDPSGRSTTRRPMSRDEIEANAQTYKEQVFRILDATQTVVDFNSRWLSQMNFEALVRLCANFTLARLMEREDFSRRLGNKQPLYLHELLYPIMQAYDSVALQADVELGGQDQLLNLLLGRDLQRAMDQPPQIVMTVPLLEGIDGVEKMSKTLGNTIGIHEPAESMFGKLMSISDTLMWRYYELLTDIPLDEIASMKEKAEKGLTNPRDDKLRLAYTITAEYHGSPAAQAAKEKFIAVFSQHQLPEDIPESQRPIPNKLLDLPTLLVEEQLAPSRTEAKRLIRSGSVSLTVLSPTQYLHSIYQLERITDPAHILSINRHCKMVVRVGKRRFKNIEFFPEDTS